MLFELNFIDNLQSLGLLNKGQTAFSQELSIMAVRKACWNHASLDYYKFLCYGIDYHLDVVLLELTFTGLMKALVGVISSHSLSFIWFKSI